MTEEITAMKCPFREKDGEFCDCYGKSCMSYYEAPFFGCGGTSAIPMCRKIIQTPQQPKYPVYNPYPQFNPSV